VGQCNSTSKCKPALINHNQALELGHVRHAEAIDSNHML
jgi:hypothetical protein